MLVGWWRQRVPGCPELGAHFCRAGAWRPSGPSGWRLANITVEVEGMPGRRLGSLSSWTAFSFGTRWAFWEGTWDQACGPGCWMLRRTGDAARETETDRVMLRGGNRGSFQPRKMSSGRSSQEVGTGDCGPAPGLHRDTHFRRTGVAGKPSE